MAVFETKFSMGDNVWDLLTKKRTRVTGIRIEKQKTNEGFSSIIVYTVAHALERTYRKEDELEKAD